MPEVNSNVELSTTLQEKGRTVTSGGRPSKVIGVAEAIVLAIVAILTAWSGFQASEWDAVSAKNYSLATRYTVLSQQKATLAGQDLLHDQLTLNAWIAAKLAGQEKLATAYERRFRPDYLRAFVVWLRLNPLQNPAAPPGPAYLPEYKNSHQSESVDLAAVATKHFDTAVSSRETGDLYVRVTVYLATVLFLTALSQRFEYPGARVAVVAVAALFLVLSLYRLISLPRIF